MYIIYQGNFRKKLPDRSPIRITLSNGYIFIHFVKNNRGNENSLSSLTKEVK